MKECTANVLTWLWDLETGKKKSIKVISNADSTDYWCVEPGNDNNRVVMSLEHCKDYEKFYIKVRAGTYYFDAEKRRPFWDVRKRVPVQDASKQLQA